MLVERHAAETYGLASAIVGSANADDLTQETFVTAWRQLPRLRDTRAFRPWLRRICVNHSRSWLRKVNRRGGPPASLDSDEAAAAGRLTDHRADFVGHAEDRALLEPAFEALSSDQRAILALHYGIGLSISEAADELGLRVGTAKSRLNAGLNVLRRALAEPDSDDKLKAVS